MRQPPTRAERWAPYVVGALLAIPVLVAKYPPMDDLPLHEASVGLWRHWSDPQFAPRDLYYLNIGHANQLFSFLVYALSFLVPIGWASKIVVAGAVFALPVAAALLADHVASPRWTALLAAPVGLGWLFFWGMIQNIIGLAALLAILPAIDRFVAQPSGKRAAWMCAAVLLFHFAHQAMQLVAMGALVLFWASLGPRAGFRARRVPLLALPVAFCVSLTVAANRYSWYLSGPRIRRAPGLVFQDLLEKIVGIPVVLFGDSEAFVAGLMLALGLAPVALLLSDRLRLRPVEPRAPLERVHAWRFELLALGLFVTYLVAPADFHGTTRVYHRFLAPAWTIFVVCAGAGTRMTGRLPARLLCGILPLASVLVTWPVFADSHRVYSDLEPLIDRIEIGSSVMTLNLDRQDEPHRLWSPTDAMGHIVAIRGGRALFDYTLSPISPVTQRASKQWLDPIDRLDENPLGFRPSWDFTRFRYVLFNTKRGGLAEAVALALKDEAALRARSGGWYLFESRLAQVPFATDDAPVPEPRPPTLRRKLAELAIRLDSPTPQTTSPKSQRE
jgi:hypothetical protein